MSQIFISKDSVLFVGGRGTKAGEANCGGGCTKAYWEANESMALIMGINGECINDSSTWSGSQNACTTQNSGGNLRIDKVAGFSNVVVGTLAYIDMTFDILYSGYNNLRYEVLTQNADYIVIDLPYQGTSPATDVKVGGAFVNMVTAINTIAVPTTKIMIYDNKNETLTGSIAPSSGGSKIKDATVDVWGFKTYPHDSDKGGPAYQDALDAYVNGIDENCFVVIDANDGAFDILSINGSNTEWVRFHNFIFKNNSGTDNDGFTMSNSPIGIEFEHCIFDDVDNYSSGLGAAILFLDCLFTNGRAAMPTGLGSAGGRYDRCIFDGPIQFQYEHVWACLFVGGTTYGCGTYWNTDISNCVFYGQTVACIKMNHSGASLNGFNNIFCPATIADYVIEIGASGGVISPGFTKNLAYSIGNGALTAMVNNIATGKTYSLPREVYEVDPLFRAPVNNDFRLKANSPILNQGVWTPGGVVV